MSKKPKDELLKARVDKGTRIEVEGIAMRLDLDLSDIVRMAIREFVEKRKNALAA